MKRLLVISAVACAALLTGCDSPPPENTAPRWQAGVHYAVLPKARATPAATARTQVVEYFSYGCPWCYLLEPQLVFWERRNASPTCSRGRAWWPAPRTAIA